VSGEDADLTQWGGGIETPPPKVSRGYIVQSPHTGKIAGFVGRERRRGFMAYTALRRGTHFYYNAEGYAISDTILDILESKGVARIFIHEGTEEDDADVFEFKLRQYLDGDEVPDDDLHDEDDPQTYVELDETVNEWPEHSGELFTKPFRRACDAIDWRGYDPELKKRKSGENA
jgi:hypothetical protein